nr:hypothetical protein [Chloroflexota bacterium]
GSNAVVTAANDVRVRATASEQVFGIAISVGFATTGGGIAATTDIHTYNLTTLAYIGSLATVYAGSNVIVSADNKSGIDIITGSAGIAGKGVGVGASVTFVDFEKDVDAYIGSGAVVDAEAKVSADTVFNGEFTVAFYDEDNTDGEVRAPDTTNKNANNESIIRSRSSIPATTAIKGVAVAAINRDDIEFITIGGGGGLYGGVQVSAAIAILRSDTLAHINDNAQINTLVSTPGGEQSVLVAAGADQYHFGVAGSLVVGAGGAGPAVHVLDVRNNTKATIGTNATVNAAEDISVVAFATEDVLSISIGLAVVGGGISAAISTVTIDATTYAQISSGAIITADGNLLVSAKDVTDILTIAGSLMFAGSGAGAGVAVTTIEKDTQATIGGGATIIARGNSAKTMTVYSGDAVAGDYKTGGNFRTETIRGLAVQAYAKEELLVVAASGSITGGGAIAGAVAVEYINSDVLASIGAGASVNNDLTGAAADQTVNVSAVNVVDVLAIAGVLTLGGGGITGGIDVGSIHNDTSAVIANNATVKAKQDIEVNALADKFVQSFAISVAAGSVGIAGAVSVWAVGGDLDSDSLTALQPSDESATDDPDHSSITEMADSNQFLDLVLELLESATGTATTPTSFDANAAIDETEDTITFAAAHGYDNGDPVVYDDGGGSSIGLNDGQIYYVVVIDSTTIKLTDSRKKALAFQPTVVELTTAGSAETHSIEALADDTVSDTMGTSADNITIATSSATFNASSGVNTGTATITVANASQLAVGDVVVYKSNGNSAIGGLTNGATYYIISKATNDIQVSTTPGGTAKILTGTGVGLHSFAKGASAVITPTSVPSGTSATIGTGGTTNAGRNIELSAVEYIDILMVTGALGIGSAGIGGAVTILNIDQNVTAQAGGMLSAGTVTSGGDILITAYLNENLDGFAIAGVGGLVGLGAQVVIFKDKGDVKALLQPNVVIEEADDVSLNAALVQYFDIYSIGVQIGGLAAG